MIIVDRALQALEQQDQPVRVGVVGAGFMGRAISRQISLFTPGMRVAAIANRTLERAAQAYRDSGYDEIVQVSELTALEQSISRNQATITDDALLLAQADGIDVIVEVTGSVEFASQVVMRAIEHGKHVILVNAELDGTLGPILKTYAERAGVIISNCDGDQPGAELNLYRYVQMIGLRPLVCGNIKGLMDHYRTPETQASFAATWQQDSYMVTNFADGSKISFEQTVVANATGMGVAARGMLGIEHRGHIDDPEHMAKFDVEHLLELGGIVDYSLGATPGPGVYILATSDDSVQQRNLDMYKLGKGPLYCFYTPFHLCYFEVPMTVARAALFSDAAVTPLAGPVVEVIATAKRDLRPGDVLDGIGGYDLYGQCENAPVSYQQNLLPIGMSQHCTVKQFVAKDSVLSYDDVTLPAGRLSDTLRSEQNQRFVPTPPRVGAVPLGMKSA